MTVPSSLVVIWPVGGFVSGVCPACVAGLIDVDGAEGGAASLASVPEVRPTVRVRAQHRAGNGDVAEFGVEREN